MLQKLNESHLKTWTDGNHWLTLHRQKTKVPVNVKLLPVALDILDKYKDTVADRGGRLLPVPIESVSKMLGHTNVRTTQIYARITDTKVNHDMTVLEGKIGGVFDKPLSSSKESRKRASDRLKIAAEAKDLGIQILS